MQPTVRKAAKRGDGPKGATKGKGRGQGRGSGPPLKEELNTALEFSDALTTVNEAPGGLSAQQAACNDHLHAHIHNTGGGNSSYMQRLVKGDFRRVFHAAVGKRLVFFHVKVGTDILFS